MKNIIEISVVILLVFLIQFCKNKDETCSTPPTITSTDISNITRTSAICECLLTNTCVDTNNGFITLSWDTASDHSYKPQVESINITGTGNYTSTITGLNENTTYYVWVEIFYHVHFGVMKDQILTVKGKTITFKTLPIGQK